MKNYTDVSMLWYDENEYCQETPNHIVFEAGAEHWLGNKGCVRSSLNFIKPSSVVEGVLQDEKKEICYKYQNNTEVTEHFEFFKTTNAIRQYNTLVNNSEMPIRINLFSSSIDIAVDGIMRWYDERRFKIHYCISSWCGETQWKTASFIDFAMGDCHYPQIATKERALFQSKGSWSTGSYYPMIVLEDMEKGRCYYFENECSSNWEIEISKPIDYLKVSLNSADIDNDGWSIILNPGECYTTTSCVYGMTKGSFEDAIRELNNYKKETSLVKWENGYAPLIYNNFMGGTWNRPDARLIPLIDAAAEVGCEVFCIDAGWFRPGDPSEPNASLGDYIISEERFYPYTLEQIINYINEKNMIAGIWFEFESVTPNAQGARISGSMCTRDGYIVSETRAFYDLTNEKVREHLFNAVERMYKIGIRYIKNDYNNSTCIGLGDGNYNENAKIQMRAMYSFVEELYDRFPGLIIENCGSGGMRSDNAMLRRFAIQSISDQEVFYKNPSILQGSLAVMPSAKAGIWTYPYHVVANDKEFYNMDEKMVKNMHIQRSLDGENTIFNMVTGNLGAMYMSGRIDWADEYNKSLIREGIDIYKKNRRFISQAFPVYPTGMKPIGTYGIATLGLVNADKSRLLLAVWKIDDFNEVFTIDLSKYVTSKSSIRLVYPSVVMNCEYNFSHIGILTIKLSGNKNMARLFEITI